MADALAIEQALLQQLGDAGTIADTGDFAKSLGVEHLAVVGVMKSLDMAEMITCEVKDNRQFELTDEGKKYVNNFLPEVQVFWGLPPKGTGGKSLAELQTQLPEGIADAGFKQAMQLRWVGIDKSSGTPQLVRIVDDMDSTHVEMITRVLREISKGPGAIPSQAELDVVMKRRRFVKLATWKTYRLSKGPKYAPQRTKLATVLTADMMANGTWRTTDFKELNFNAFGTPYAGGALHPLLKVRTQFRKIFTQMGFEEMPTNNYVESSFWNFDALFQPQQHPARDAHDTFFLTHPASTYDFPEDYLQRVKAVHEHGGYGSVGYGYSWKRSEAQRNLLRTHTTAVSSRMLYRLAQEGFRPAKYFSIDRVFRNETVDRTHLAEFHQVEGLVCDVGLTLGDLIGVLNEFFSRLGLKKLRFKPAFNPYTEPSMEIFSYSEELGKWMEVGNSGMFRPEMLQPMGLPPDVNVIAWGLSLERPTMILYGIDNIRDLFGHKVSLSMVQKNPICRLGL